MLIFFVCTFFGIFPQGFLLLEEDLLLNLGLLVELVEVVDDDGDGEGDAEHAADRAGLKGQACEIEQAACLSRNNFVQINTNTDAVVHI